MPVSIILVFGVLNGDLKPLFKNQQKQQSPLFIGSFKCSYQNIV
jgi:hypothetical protein